MSARCKSCEAPIIWADTESGRAMPLDEAPVANGPQSFWDAGAKNAALVDMTRRGIMVLLPGARTRSATPEDIKLRRPLFTSHFATCPDANKFRRAR